MVRARLATSRPNPAKLKAPSTLITASVTREPRTPTPNISRPNPTSAATSRNRNSSRERMRSEEHTSELQSPCNLVCRLLLEKKKNVASAAKRETNDY